MNNHSRTVKSSIVIRRPITSALDAGKSLFSPITQKHLEECHGHLLDSLKKYAPIVTMGPVSSKPLPQSGLSVYILVEAEYKLDSETEIDVLFCQQPRYAAEEFRFKTYNDWLKEHPEQKM